MNAPEAPFPFSRVALVGLGVMGGSLARALAHLDDGPAVTGWSAAPEDVAAALDEGVLTHAAGSLEDCVAESDLVVLATPVQAVCELLPAAAAAAPEAAVLHDVASLKAPVEAAAEAAGVAHRWIGGHPMAGSEASGFPASRPGLYRGARVWLVPGAGALDTLPAVAAFWRALGGRPLETDAAAHDDLMGLASHLPQLASTALAEVLMERGIGPADLGPGGLDATRLAASSPTMWTEILQHRPDVLPEALRALSGALADLADRVEERDVAALWDLLERTREWRRSQ